jgi:hypothetical protein
MDGVTLSHPSRCAAAQSLTVSQNRDKVTFIKCVRAN